MPTIPVDIDQSTLVARSLSGLTLLGCKSMDSDQLHLSNSSNRPGYSPRSISTFDSLPCIFASSGQTRQAPSSIASAALAYGFCWAMDMKPGVSAAIAAGVGIGLYALGVVPIGLMIFVALVSGGAILKKLFSSGAEEDEEYAQYRQKPQPSEEKPQAQHLQEKPASESAPVGRNAPCPCGSGKRYKHCCGKLE